MCVEVAPCRRVADFTEVDAVGEQTPSVSRRAAEVSCRRCDPVSRCAKVSLGNHQAGDRVRCQAAYARAERIVDATVTEWRRADERSAGDRVALRESEALRELLAVELGNEQHHSEREASLTRAGVELSGRAEQPPSLIRPAAKRLESAARSPQSPRAAGARSGKLPPSRSPTSETRMWAISLGLLVIASLVRCSS